MWRAFCRVWLYCTGAVLKESGGRANPKLANDILMRKLDGE